MTSRSNAPAQRGEKLPLDWTKHLASEEDRKEFEDLLRRSSVLTRRIKEMLVHRLESLESKELSAKAYESASWPYLQADIIGSRRELKYLISLFDYLKE